MSLRADEWDLRTILCQEWRGKFGHVNICSEMNLFMKFIEGVFKVCKIETYSTEINRPSFREDHLEVRDIQSREMIHVIHYAILLHIVKMEFWTGFEG